MEPQPRAPEPEFDAYASHYAERLDDPLKRLLGGGLDQYIAVKVRWLLRYLRHTGLAGTVSGGSLSLLDYGCGTGEFLISLRRPGYCGKLAGADVSGKMLAQARLALGDDSSLPLYLLAPGEPTLAEGAFDVVVACCVFHHIPDIERDFTNGLIYRLLRPGGHFVMFEHNPLNPVTVTIVRRSPVDHDAVLLGAAEARDRMRRAGFCSVRTEYLLFAPARLRWLGWVDRLLSWLPLGGQYAVRSIKPV